MIFSIVIFNINFLCLTNIEYELVKFIQTVFYNNLRVFNHIKLISNSFIPITFLAREFIYKFKYLFTKFSHLSILDLDFWYFISIMDNKLIQDSTWKATKNIFKICHTFTFPFNALPLHWMKISFYHYKSITLVNDFYLSAQTVNREWTGKICWRERIFLNAEVRKFGWMINTLCSKSTVFINRHQSY